MINSKDLSYKAIIVTESGQQLDITAATQDLGWEENEDELAMKISFDLYNAFYNGKRLSSLVKLCSVVAIQASWGSGSDIVAQGQLTQCRRKTSKSDEVFSITAYDNLYNLQKSSDCVFFEEGKGTQSILTSLLSSWGISISSYTGPNVTHARILKKNAKLGTIIRDILSEAKKKGGGAGIVRSTKGKIEVIKKGNNSTVYAFLGDNVTEVSHEINIASIVTRVKVVSSDGSDSAAKVEAIVDGKTDYGVFQKIITKTQSGTLEDAKKEAQDELDENGSPTETARLTGPDVPPLRKGDMIYAKVGSLDGFYLIKSIQHSAKDRKFSAEVEKYVASTITKTQNTSTESKSYKVGDIVRFKGGMHYISSYPGAKGYQATAGEAKITLGPDCKANGRAHPWQLIHTSNSTSNVYGWVDEGSFE